LVNLIESGINVNATSLHLSHKSLKYGVHIAIARPSTNRRDQFARLAMKCKLFFGRKEPS